MARILVIDDEELVRESIRVTLESAGHNVVEAKDGQQGINQQKEQGFDLVISDIIMPEKEGLETILDLKKEISELKIIAISGGGRTRSLDLLSVAKDLGSDRVLAKPFTNAELLQCVDECLLPEGP